MPAPKKYEDWEEAAMNSLRKEAIAKFGTKYDIIKPLKGNGYITFRNLYRPVIRKATTGEVDQVKLWLAF